MVTARIAIVGAGLSGLYVAWLLEARDMLGGRIASVSASGLLLAQK